MKTRMPFGGFFLELLDEQNGTCEYEEYQRKCEEEPLTEEEQKEQAEQAKAVNKELERLNAESERRNADDRIRNGRGHRAGRRHCGCRFRRKLCDGHMHLR